MNEYQMYFAEEIAEECGHGHISQSEALRRLRLLGVSAAVALSLLAAACGGEDNNPSQSVASNTGSTNDSPAPTPSPTPSATPTGSSTSTPAAMPSPAPPGGGNNEGNPVPVAPPAAMPGSSTPAGMAMMPAPAANPTPAVPPGDPAAISGVGMGLPTEAITFTGPNGPLQGAFAAAAQPRGAVLVIHENRGLNDHIRTVVGRFAAAGFTAIGLDLLSEEGGTAAATQGDPNNAPAALGAVPTARFVADMRACLDELQRRAPGAKLGAVGFCFGGGMMWQLIASGDERLAAAAPFYGPLPNGASFTGSQAAVLAFYGALDTRVNATQAQAETALTAAGLTHEIVTEPNANHAFFNDTGANFNAAAANDAWTRVLAWFGEHLS